MTAVTILKFLNTYAVLWDVAIAGMVFGSLGGLVGVRQRTCLLAHVIAWSIAVAAALADLAGVFVDGRSPGPSMVTVAFCALMLVVEIRRYRRHKDDDDDRKPPRRPRRSLRWKPDLSGLVLPGVLQPARGAA